MPSVSLPTAVAGAGLVGAGLSSYGAYEGGQATAASANYQAQVAANNAKIAQENAQMEAASGASKEAAQGMKTAATAATAKAAQGASGIDVNTGSAANVRQAIGKLGALDALTIRSNTARSVYGYEVAATSDTAQSQLLEMQASQAQSAGDISALGTFLSGASSVGAKFAPLQPQAPNFNPNTSGGAIY
jgi:membrane protein involved in colicin uptake